MSIWHKLWHALFYGERPLTYEELEIEACLDAIERGELGEYNPKLITQRRKQRD